MADHTAGAVAPAGAPVDAGERIGLLDSLRGFALLGILPMNMPWFALAEGVWLTPGVHGGFTGANYALWLIGHVVFDQKMMSIFSMLFGAGIVLFAGRAERAGRSPAAMHYRRMLALLAIGIVHAYLIWWGDILVAYALCAMLVYPARRMPARRLLVLGALVFLVAVPFGAMHGVDLTSKRDAADAANAAWRELDAAGGGPPAPDQLKAIAAWEKERADLYTTPEDIANEHNLHTGPYIELLAAHAKSNWWFHTWGMLFWGVWRIGGLMMIGMGLFKLGALPGTRSVRFYATLTALGYGLGVPLVLAGVVDMHAHAFDPVYMHLRGEHFNYVGSLLVALGHIGLFALLWRLGVGTGVMRRLACVGRMAFSNYLAQSLICTFLFYGWGLGWWGSLERTGLALVVLVVWAAQLAWSPWWLARFRFGPAEWLWRTLTYARPQPMRLE